MMEFDMSRHVHAETIKDLPRAESFFGPFEDASKAARFFLSLSAPLAYDVEKYQYESESESTETGHVFALFPTTGDHKHVGFSAPSLKKGKKEQKTRHYLKKNLGARLDSIDLTHAPAGNITFRYKDGDICENLVRYSAEVTLVCDKDPQAQNVLITNAFSICCARATIECEYKLEWRTPYACSQCKASDTRKEMVRFLQAYTVVDMRGGEEEGGHRGGEELRDSGQQGVHVCS